MKQKNKKDIRYAMRHMGCALCAALILCCSCSDETEVAKAPHIVRSELNFDAAAAKGYALLSDAHYTASSEATWCRIEQKGDSVLVYVEDNTALEGRNALLTITDESGKTQYVPIHQQGGFFRLDQEATIHIGDSSSVQQIAVASSFEYETTCNAGWFTLEQHEGKLNMTVDKNTTGAPRHATATCYCPALDKTLTIAFIQYSLDDLMGTWTASYAHNSGETIEKTVELKRQGTKDIRLSGLREGVTLKAEPHGMSFSFATHTPIGKYNNRYDMYQFGVDKEHMVYSREKESRVIHYTAKLSIADDMLTCSFEGDSTFSNGERMEGIIVSGYSEGSLSARAIEEFYQLTLKR